MNSITIFCFYNKTFKIENLFSSLRSKSDNNKTKTINLLNSCWFTITSYFGSTAYYKQNRNKMFLNLLRITIQFLAIDDASSFISVLRDLSLLDMFPLNNFEKVFSASCFRTFKLSPSFHSHHFYFLRYLEIFLS